MRLVNTTTGQDNLVRAAEEAENHVDNLIGIISELDDVISEWKAATGCDTPDEAARKMADLEESQ